MTNRARLVLTILALIAIEVFAFLGMSVGAFAHSGRTVFLCFLISTAAAFIALMALHKLRWSR